jgi:shikimate dehydrogenase
MTTRSFAVIGDPVGQSASPRMHRAAYGALGLHGTYDAIRATDEDLPGLFARLRAGDLDGLNVTIPLKRRVFELADRVDASAAVAGAANTLARADDARIVAYNTDVAALAAELRDLAKNVPPDGWRRALVLGTGATARSAIVALAAHLGVAQITVRGRALVDGERKEAFATELTELLRRAGSACAWTLEPWAPNAATDREVLAVVQATSVGMPGGDPGDRAAEAVAWSAMPPGAIALDVVYASAETPFLAAAAARGMSVRDGRGMLARQGALAFELWWGRPAPLSVMRAAIAG